MAIKCLVNGRTRDQNHWKKKRMKWQNSPNEWEPNTATKVQLSKKEINNVRT